MASIEYQMYISMVQARLNQASEERKKSKQVLQEAPEVKRNFDSFVESTKMKSCEDNNKERQKQSENSQWLKVCCKELKCLQQAYQRQKENSYIIRDDLFKGLKSVINLSNGKHLVYKEFSDKNSSFAAEAVNETAGSLESEKRHSESGGRLEIEKLSAEAGVTAPVCSKFGKDEVPDGINITPLVCSDVNVEKNRIEENAADESNSATKIEVPIAALDGDETVNPCHVYAKVIILNKTEDGSDVESFDDSQNDIIPSTSTRWQCEDHDDHFDEIIVTGCSDFDIRKESNKKSKSKKEKKRKTIKREKLSKAEKKSVRENKVLTTTSTKFYQRLLNLFCFSSNIEETEDFE